MEVNFNGTVSEEKAAISIALRASKRAEEVGYDYPRLDAEMDILACHLNGNPLKLWALLGADDFNFDHDVFGIHRHIDRETGRLKDFFLPRYSEA